MLSVDDFSAFFREVHGHEPFPWQRRLTGQVAESGAWPEVLGLPTGSGKTAAIDIAVFHLALEAARGPDRRAPVRIAFVVDRRLVVDDAFARAQKLADALRQPCGPVTARVAEALKQLSPDGPPLIASRLRGGIPREDDWARTPSQPTVLCSTVDQVGSRLLFRGYGVSDGMKPIHAGLLGSDCLILLDEAHLAEPFRQTLGWVSRYHGAHWRERDLSAPWGVALLTATPGQDKPSFALDDADRRHPILSRRLIAAKPAHLVELAKDADGVDAILGQVRQARTRLDTPAIGVVVNRVARARAVFERVCQEHPDADALLLIGPARPVDRDGLAGQLGPIRTGKGDERSLDKPMIVVATQCLEAGVDIDLDALITDAAPLDALRQRFGRLNRAGRNITPYAAILAGKAELSSRTVDPVYGKAIKAAWEHLGTMADGDRVVDFGLNAVPDDLPADCLSPRDDAPVLLPAHLDLLSQTAPIPSADPEVALYLHGPNRQPDAITVVWRADLDPDAPMAEEDISRLLKLVPPRAGEAIALPLWAVRDWLNDGEAGDDLADVGAQPRAEVAAAPRPRRAFRWTGGDERSRWILPRALRPGDTIVVPARYGGVDAFGWNPRHKAPAADVAQRAACPFAGRRYAVRVAPGLVDDADGLAAALAGAASSRWTDVRAALLARSLPEALKAELEALGEARTAPVVHLDVYGTVNGGQPRGAVFVAPRGLQGLEDSGHPGSTEDDAEGSLPGYSLSLERHSAAVEQRAEEFARRAGLPPDAVADVALAGRWHDAGKKDPRFQAWLQYGDPLGSDTVLAKSDRPLPRAARSASLLPPSWRHEALSVRLAQANGLAEAGDPELVLWLVGSHHGHGRPLFPHRDDEDTAALPPGPESLGFDWHGLDWPSLFERLKARYGVWHLARLEAILRLADHRASERKPGREVA